MGESLPSPKPLPHQYRAGDGDVVGILRIPFREMDELRTLPFDFGRQTGGVRSDDDRGFSGPAHFTERAAGNSRAVAQQDKTRLAEPIEGMLEGGDFKDRQAKHRRRRSANALPRIHIDAPPALHHDRVDPESGGTPQERAQIPGIGEVDDHKKP